ARPSSVVRRVTWCGRDPSAFITHTLIPLGRLTVNAISRPFGDQSPLHTVIESPVTCRGERPFASAITRCEAVQGPTSERTRPGVRVKCGAGPGYAPTGRSPALSGQSS